MTKAEIVTQIRIWIKENDSTSEFTDSQIYSLVDAGLRLWMAKVKEWCGMAGFKSFTSESLAVDSDGKSAEFTTDPFLIIEAAINYGGTSYRKMKRIEGTYEEGDDRVNFASSDRPQYRLLATDTPAWQIEVSPHSSGTAKVRFVADPGTFADADATIPTSMVTMAENGLACYTAGIYWENQGGGQTDADRCYDKAEEYLKMMPRGFRG